MWFLSEEQVENFLTPKNSSTSNDVVFKDCFTHLNPDEEKNELQKCLQEFNLENTYSHFHINSTSYIYFY